MPRKPKRKPESGRQAAERPFVGREELVAPFHAALKEPQHAKPLVLVYYGGAGIGKSRLRRELVRQMSADPSVVTATLDFAIPSFRQPDAALLFLRNTIHEAYKVRFPSFDLAYAIYWQKAHPDAPLASGDMTGLARLSAEENRACTHSPLPSQLLDDSGKLPLIGLVPKISSLLASQPEPENPRTLEPPLRSWWERRGERELEDLPQMEPAAIVGCLPKLWAADLKEFIVPRSSFIVGRRAVLFIDAYEQLWGTGDEGQRTRDEGQKTDEWVRELVKQLPEALWVICGRQKLRWEEVEPDWKDALSQHELKALPDQSARQFLASCGIASEPIQDAIVKGSQGMPHYLDLAVDAVQNAECKMQNAEFGGGSPEELQKQFVRHLDKPELEALQVLSAPRYWYYGLFENLMSEYETGYPASAYDDLARFSFVKEGAAPGTQTMHELMREALQEEQSPEIRKRVHLFLHEHYAKQLDGIDVKGITDQPRLALTEAFYHGRQAKTAAEVCSWFKDAVAVFEKVGLHRLVLPLFREVTPALESELGPGHPDTTAALWRLAESLAHLDEYAEAETLERQVLAANEKTFGTEHPLVGDNLHDLAGTLNLQGRYAEAEALYQRALAIKEKSLGPVHASTARTLASLAGVTEQQAKHAEAEPLFRRALAIYEQSPGPGGQQVARALDALATLLGEEGKYADAEPLRRRALAITEETLGSEHPEAARIRGNLAGLLCSQGRFKEAEPEARQSLATHEKILGSEHTDVAYSLWVVSKILALQGKHAEAEPLMRRALAIWEKRLGPEHDDVALGLDSLAIILEE